MLTWDHRYLGVPRNIQTKHIFPNTDLNQPLAPVIFDQNSSRNMEYTKTRRPPINRMILNERSPCKSRVNLKTCHVGGTPQDQPPRLVSSPVNGIGVDAFKIRTPAFEPPLVKLVRSNTNSVQAETTTSTWESGFPVRNLRIPARRTGRFRKIAARQVKQTSSNIQEIHKVRWRSTAGVCSKHSKFFRMNRKCSWDTSNHPQNHSAWAVPK